MIDNEITLKRFHREKNHVRLEPANGKMQRSSSIRTPTRRFSASSSACCGSVEVGPACQRHRRAGPVVPWRRQPFWCRSLAAPTARNHVRIDDLVCRILMVSKRVRRVPGGRAWGL